MTLVAARGAFSSQAHVDTLVSGFTLARDLSWSFSCPSHCGQSSFLPFLAGLSLGSLVTLLLLAWIALYLGLHLPAPAVPSTAQAFLAQSINIENLVDEAEGMKILTERHDGGVARVASNSCLLGLRQI